MGGSTTNAVRQRFGKAGRLAGEQVWGQLFEVHARGGQDDRDLVTGVDQLHPHAVMPGVDRPALTRLVDAFADP
ncbi:MAG: hypothetical protein V3W34_01090 [Phycisphaerae bacterium]